MASTKQQHGPIWALKTKTNKIKKPMGREIRLVVPNWEHPKYQHTDYLLHRTEMRYQPMYDCPYSEAIEVWIENHQLWEAGNHKDQLDGSGKDCRYFAEWHGDAPEVKYYRPDWKPEEMTWYQVYETVSEGTPVTPPFATRDELIDYLANHGDFWDQLRGDKPWTRKQAERFVNGPGWAPSFIAENGEFKSGVEALGD